MSIAPAAPADTTVIDAVLKHQETARRRHMDARKELAERLTTTDFLITDRDVSMVIDAGQSDSVFTTAAAFTETTDGDPRNDTLAVEMLTEWNMARILGFRAGRGAEHDAEHAAHLHLRRVITGRRF